MRYSLAMRLGLFLTIVILSACGGGGCNPCGAPSTPVAGVPSAPPAPPAIVRVAGEKGPLLPVSMTPVGDGRFLLVNYQNVYLFDTDPFSVKPVTIDTKLPEWTPTAITRSENDGTFVIANYTGQDVLVTRLDETGPAPTLKLQERLTHPQGIIGAEGVDVSTDGRYMAVASYEGMSVSLFEKQAGHWAYRWTAPNLPGSHGIVIVGSDVYASGQAAIVRLDLATGTEELRITATGSRQLKFVTCLDFDEPSGGLVASDTIAGRVMMLDLDLNLVSEMGANGPTYSNFSMPYCAYRDEKALYVLSTYQDRIIEVAGGETRAFNFGAAGWAYGVDLGQWPGGALDNNYVSLAPPVSLMGATARASYGSLKLDNGPVLLTPSQQGLLGTGWLFYLVGVIEEGDWTVISANSSPGVLLYNKKTGALGRKMHDEWDCWAVAQKLACPSRTYTVSDLVSGAAMANPAPTLAGIASHLSVSIDELRQQFTSEQGKAMLASLDSGVIPQTAAQAYIKAVPGFAVPILEYWIAHSLATAS